MRRTRSRHVGRSVVSGATTPNRNSLVPSVAVEWVIVPVLTSGRGGVPVLLRPVLQPVAYCGPRSASHPCYERHCPDPTPPPKFCRGSSGTPVVSDPATRRVRGDRTPLLMRAQCGRDLGP